MAEQDQEALLILVTAMTSVLDRLDSIADRVADIAVFAEAIYVDNMKAIQEREGIR